MEDFMTMMMPYIVSTMATILAAIGSYVGLKIKAIYEEKANTDTKKKVVETTCKYVEQLYSDLNGEEKLNKAIQFVTQQLEEKGITITELELRVLIEATVNGFKDKK